ncbi:hypothetical protein DQ04_02051090 [Trypanosoma grayi]|uniref:hypothetical protein n=1 Tax=Trypanosoma grayi TaxID=71804 RepID=UPI0004F44FEB|nr:hypothetical protein DQ04_02051090 [Trypanosoma grayi]KEG12044.1 hypothetical protein DQ04_02051090 [Trypanosoma grayi]
MTQHPAIHDAEAHERVEPAVRGAGEPASVLERRKGVAGAELILAIREGIVEGARLRQLGGCHRAVRLRQHKAAVDAQLKRLLLRLLLLLRRRGDNVLQLFFTLLVVIIVVERVEDAGTPHAGFEGTWYGSPVEKQSVAAVPPTPLWGVMR